ncbi:MAG TPA: protein kinase [Archangium sp.]|uniref:serine/threonine protein kinase n=1 Tax=Archangium sp. TaxID=1872627 RepID=UPI002E33D045|nr:protein kinase [Archangium sp.]HEX5746911.1 protein kinase [Archangium sp.]
MNEPGAGTPQPGGTRARGVTDRRRELARLRGLEAESDAALLAALPPLGTEVEGLVLERVLGQGGYGTVYLARREGRPYAVKFTSLPRAAQWALRELGAMVRMETVGGVGLRGHGVWPAEQPLFQFIVMDYVPGQELYTWALHPHRTALEVVEVLLDLARELGAAHGAGVVHRDVRGDNVLVRETDGRALLVDFGVATFPGAPRATGPEVPGCREYLSPEVVRFNRGEREHHEASGLDDLWSLGVMTYRLLTASYPFQGHNAAELERAILHEAPEPPHVRNPRVPQAMSGLCLRLLEKEPHARYPDTQALDAALMEVKRGADETWKVPLREPGEAPATKDEPPAVAGQRPRRGHRGAVLAGGLVLLAAAWLSLFLFTGAPSIPREGTPRAALPEEFFPVGWEPAGQEVAPPRKGPEGDGGAAPSGATTPAPVASATLAKDSQRVKTARSAPPPSRQKQQAPATGPMAAGMAAVCTLLSGCPGAQVRPPPPPVECPAGAVKAMEELGVFEPGYPIGTALTAPNLGQSMITVRGGPVTVVTMDDKGKLEAGSALSGQLIIGKDRVYGRLTEARTPRGDTFPVCFQFMHRDKPGVPIRGEGPGPELPRITSFAAVIPVRRFE